MNELLLIPSLDYRRATEAEQFPYQAKIETAKRWLGRAYLCYKPINRKNDHA